MPTQAYDSPRIHDSFMIIPLTISSTSADFLLWRLNLPPNGTTYAHGGKSPGINREIDQKTQMESFTYYLNSFGLATGYEKPGFEGITCSYGIPFGLTRRPST